MTLVINQLNKTYSNGVQALKDVNLTINQGMFGLLGPNGAGKSSLMRTIATLQEPDSGEIFLGDINVLTEKEEIRKTLGYLPQEFGVYPKVSAVNLLNHIAVLKGITNSSERKNVVEALLQKTNLWESRKKNLGGYSGGMKQRFGIAQALLANPKLIIVDEPTAGLDPAERNRFLNLLSELGENTVVILSTHIVEDVKELCSDMAVFNKGQILYKGNPDDALGELNGKVWSKRIKKDELADFKANFKVISEKLIAGNPVINVLSDENPDGTFESIDADLEDVYFSKIFLQA
ncbi:ABC transporter ATP-binding protein [Lacihabitans sp. LS3-19]|uniref:ABC transporter ATP-binding protein n=1 Tax=Lacihabitans sp. LS3-19 TaxID=2487335 RepID=UPI0020CDC3F7|nr:ABC transporter ATP-binding protein [Lacihabitans sp. LS3-19]MCP9770997.1 ABC transporter ATP-binding protein [Lacihabitans sp. LS3-19]